MIYFDNSATTNPKPHKVMLETYNSLLNYSYNSGRGGYRASIAAADKIYSVRESLSSLTGAQAQCIAFTQNCTLALNMAIKGLARKNSHILISSLEHNAVLRAVHSLSKTQGISYDAVPFYYDPDEQLEAFESLIREDTSLIVCTMASNVFGCVMPIGRIGRLAKKYNIPFVVDGAQGVGVLDVDVNRDNIDMLCCAGHKGLYGPLALGFIAANTERAVNTVIEGGTGSMSASLDMPDSFPDRLESGSLSNSLIAGLGAGADFVSSYGVGNIYRHELEQIQYIYSAMKSCPKVRLYTPYPEKNMFVPILSFNIEGMQSEQTAHLLAEKNIAVRGGLHCAVLAHKSFGTQDTGTVRISPSVFTTKKECDFFINSVKKL